MYTLVVSVVYVTSEYGVHGALVVSVVYMYMLLVSLVYMYTLAVSVVYMYTLLVSVL